MNNKLEHRIATFADARQLYDWATDQTTRASSLNSAIFSFEEHCEWLKRVLENQNKRIYIFFDSENKDVGVLRLEIAESEVILSYSVDCAFRGLGYGTEIIKQAEVLLGGEHALRTIVATVKESNRPSARIFEKLGYEKTKKEDLFLFKKQI